MPMRAVDNRIVRRNREFQLPEWIAPGRQLRRPLRPRRPSYRRRLPRRARPEAAYAAAWRSLHHAGIDAAKDGASLGPQDVSIGDRKVVARDRQVEIVFQRKSDGVLQRDVEFAVMDELLQP